MVTCDAPVPAEDVMMQVRGEFRGSELVGESEAMRALRRQIAAVAPLQSGVLVCGETGVGKGLIAKLLHRNSPRASAAFVHVDCAALSPSLAESELFGHERGSFTGAVMRRLGRFEQAAHGTVFLDEIGDITQAQQVKLLRVLEDREFERLGGNQTLPMSARVIAATSRDLSQAVADAEFRADLYFRLNVIRLVVPPLRERHGDIELLVAAGLKRLTAAASLPAPEFAKNALDRLAAYDWPGNVRELMNVLERLLVCHAAGPVVAEEVESALQDGSIPRARERSELLASAGSCALARSEDSADRIGAVLQASGGNVARAARRLGIPRSTLRHRIRRDGIH